MTEQRRSMAQSLLRSSGLATALRRSGPLRRNTGPTRFREPEVAVVATARCKEQTHGIFKEMPLPRTVNDV